MSSAEMLTQPQGLRLSPTGLPSVPVLGHLLDIRKDMLGFFERCAREHGDVSLIKLATAEAVLINNSDLIEEVLVEKADKFVKNHFFWRQLDAIMGGGLFTSEDEEWRKQRKHSSPAFRTQELEAYAPHMVQLVDQLVGSWKDGQEFDMHREILALGLKISAKTLLNADVEQDIEDLEKAAYWLIDEIAARFSRPFVIPDAVPLPGHIRYLKGVAYLDRLVYRVIDEFRSGKIEPAGFLASLMAVRDEDGKPLSDKQLRDQVLTMLLAGYETTALSMSFGFDLLGQNREYQDRMADEVRAVTGDRPVTYEDLPKLPLTEWAVIETMRVLPPAWAVGREAREDVEIGDYLIRKGTGVIISSWVTHRDPRYFDDPTSFRPERWAGDFRRKLPRFAYYPFGGGPRICIGNRFAMMEAMLFLATIAKRFDVERLTERPYKLLPSITIRPTGGIWVRLHERK